MFPVLCFGQNVNIPDANFKAYLVGNLDINTNGDGEIQLSEASVFDSLMNLSKLNISDLTGIEAFTALTSLDCSQNQLSTLDLINNTSLTNMYCRGNQLTTLDVSKNTALRVLDCSQNQLSTLDLTKNIALRELYCEKNKLTNLDVSKNTALTELSCEFNKLTSLDVSKNTALTYLYCGEEVKVIKE